MVILAFTFYCSSIKGNLLPTIQEYSLSFTFYCSSIKGPSEVIGTSNLPVFTFYCSSIKGEITQLIDLKEAAIYILL